MAQLAAPREGAARKRPFFTQRRQEAMYGYIFAAPFLIGFVFLTLGPMLFSLYASFTEYDIVNAPKWVGGVACIEINVTAMTGTSPTMDVVVQESIDGSNWIDVWHFERITGVGQYYSPPIYFQGKLVRYVQTLGGTSPNVTRTVLRAAQPFDDNSASQAFRIYDRAVAVNTLNATTASLRSRGCGNYSIALNMGAIITTAPVLQLQGSDDGGVTWYDITGGSVTGVASSTVVVFVVNVYAQMVRARVSTAGSGATLGYVALKAF